MDIPFTYVAQGNMAELRAYLTKAEITTVDERGNSFLHLAIKFNQAEVFQFLIDNYIDINMQNNDGETPLMLCVYYNRIGFLKALIKKKADHLIPNKLGETPFYKACFLGRGIIVSLFMENKMETLNCKNTNEEDIYFALLRSQNVTLLDVFAKKDKNFIKTTNYFNETLLHAAVKLNSIALVEYLLEHDAFVNAKNKAKETPLFYAAKNGNNEILSMLVNKGAVIELINTYDESIFDVVEYHAFKDYIYEKQNSVSYQKYIKEFPLHYAVIIEDIFQIEQNLNAKNIDKIDIYDKKPIDLAYELNNKEIVKMIQDYKKNSH